MKFEIEVTQSHIDGSNGLDGQNCMVFRALRPIFSMIDAVGVQHVMFRDKKGREIAVELPIDVQSRVIDHYEGLPQTPFKFTWEVPKRLCDS